jgi:predicted molibdopterin-dependent oxidoreductase YjgC
VLTELSAKLGDETGAGSAEEVFELLAAESPIYSGITYDAIGGRGGRWQEAGAERSAQEPTPAPSAAGSPGGSEARASVADGSLLLGTYHDLWADYVSERNPALEFLSPTQTVELSEATAMRLGVGNGTPVEVTGHSGSSLRAQVAIRHRTPDQVAFLIEGTREGAANLLSGAGTVEIAEAAPEPGEEPPAGSAERETVEW